MSVTIPPDELAMLKETAKVKKVSVAWVIREAIEQYTEAIAEKEGYKPGEKN